MSATAQIANLLIGTAFSLAIGILWVRFLLQLVQADFYNPIAQWIVKVTAPILNPIQKVLPPVKGWNLGILGLIFLLQMVSMTLIAVLSTGGTLSPLVLIIGGIFQLLYMATEFYFWLLLISVVLSWISPGYSPFGALIAQLGEPVLAPFRKILPPMGGLDLSIILVFLAIQVVQILLGAAAKQFMGFI
ncbi:MAG: YggT family protein [Moraxellaceae bacterium]|jgi:YggT family protein|nr:YggT family protein [Moraxellaceae bacterium]MBK7300488.1 YggT family protein [Moraxellaceae bacterium]MCC6375354.1 YggT family protein [Moraxellaceae bacterium]HQV80284.1 YggT family protein [Agitococcus sp.]